jgi:hypothetical protein
LVTSLPVRQRGARLPFTLLLSPCGPQNSDVANLKSETLFQQFEITKKETNTSVVCKFGDASFDHEPLSDFQSGPTNATRASLVVPAKARPRARLFRPSLPPPPEEKDRCSPLASPLSSCLP